MNLNRSKWHGYENGIPFHVAFSRTYGHFLVKFGKPVKHDIFVIGSFESDLNYDKC